MFLRIKTHPCLPVGERRDDESVSAAEVFVLIGEVDVSDEDAGAVEVLFEVEAALLQPLKVVDVAHVDPTLHAINSNLTQKEEFLP
jgi:hypothetical protein